MLLLFLLFLSLIQPTLSTNTTSEKPRIFILSDILNEPDDSQSLVRYLLYANEFQTEGIVATTSTWLQNETHPEAIREIIHAYGSVVDNLNQHVPEDKQYPSEEELLAVVFSGPTVYGKLALNSTLSPGASHLIKSLKSSNNTLHLPIWGGTNTLAQALQHISETHSPTEAKTLRSRLHIYTISDQDDTGPWLRATYPDLFYIASRHAWKAYSLAAWTGMSTMDLSPAANDSIVQNAWLKRYIQLGRLGGVYPDIEYTMEGDSPSLLYFIPNGLGQIERPGWGSWGGRYSPLSDDDSQTQFADTLDTVYYTSANKTETETETSNQATIFRWRSAFQTDFAARMQWTLSPKYTSARHPPVIRVNGHEGLDPLILHARLNQSLTFDASETLDADQQDDLHFEWYQYQDPSYRANPGPQTNERLDIQPLPEGQVVELNEQGFTDAVRAKKVRVTLPAMQSTQVVDGYHLILQVGTGGEVPVTRYKRVVLVV